LERETMKHSDVIAGSDVGWAGGPGLNEFSMLFVARTSPPEHCQSFVALIGSRASTEIAMV
jgi:hypothetical protein